MVKLSRTSLGFLSLSNFSDFGLISGTFATIGSTLAVVLTAVFTTVLVGATAGVLAVGSATALGVVLATVLTAALTAGLATVLAAVLAVGATLVAAFLTTRFAGVLTDGAVAATGLAAETLGCGAWSTTGVLLGCSVEDIRLFL